MNYLAYYKLQYMRNIITLGWYSFVWEGGEGSYLQYSYPRKYDNILEEFMSTSHLYVKVGLAQQTGESKTKRS
jgi:hypothetical protein